MRDSNPQSNRPDPAKAIRLKRGQRSRKRQPRQAAKSEWQPHRGSEALDGWGVAIRLLREQGHRFE